MLQNLASQTGVSAIGHFAADWARRIGGLAFEAGQLAAAAEQLGGTRILLLIIFLVGVLAGCCCCTTCTLVASVVWHGAGPARWHAPAGPVAGAGGLSEPPVAAPVRRRRVRARARDTSDESDEPAVDGGDPGRGHLPARARGASAPRDGAVRSDGPAALARADRRGRPPATPPVLRRPVASLAPRVHGAPRVLQREAGGGGGGAGSAAGGAAAGKLVASENRRWLITASEDDSDVNVLADFDACEWYAVCDSLAVVKAGGKVYLAKAVTEKQAESSMDARVMPILHGLDGERRRVFKDAVRGMSETPWTGWPVKGPRTALWCVRFLAEQDSHPRARHTKWRAECGLGPADVGVSDHELAMRALELGAGFDQLNLTELALVELLVRRAQLAEWRHRERLLKSSGDEYLEDEYLYMGTSETRGLLMVCPTLVEHIQAELHKEATLMKEKRKLREERMLSRGQGSGGGGGGGNKALQDKVAAQAAEISKLQAKLKGPQTGSKGAGGGGGQ
eukprot:9491354-Pyramimonas_sp.AAC.1